MQNLSSLCPAIILTCLTSRLCCGSGHVAAPCCCCARLVCARHTGPPQVMNSSHSVALLPHMRAVHAVRAVVHHWRAVQIVRYLLRLDMDTHALPDCHQETIPHGTTFTATHAKVRPRCSLPLLQLMSAPGGASQVASLREPCFCRSCRGSHVTGDARAALCLMRESRPLVE